MIVSADRLREALQDSEILPTLSLSEWDLLIRQAQRAGVLARLAIQLDARNLLDAVPAAPCSHLRAERALAEKHERDVRWEVHCIQAALTETGVPVILLKGAAYTLADLPPARGRLFNDIDILVPRAALDAAAQSLRNNGRTPAYIVPSE